MDANAPQVVVVEKVERNLREFASDPAVFQGPELNDERLAELGSAQMMSDKASVCVREAESNVDFWQIDGTVDEAVMTADSAVYVMITGGDGSGCYEAFGITDDTTDCGYRLYLDKDSVESDNITISVYISDGNSDICVAQQDVDLTSVETLN